MNNEILPTMEKLIKPGSGVDDLGAGVALGCLKWGAIIVVAALLLLKLFDII